MLLQSRRRPVLLDVVVLFVVTCMSFAAADNWDGLLDTARAYIIGRVVHSRRRTLRASMAPNTDGRSPHANSNSEDPDTVSTIDPLDDKTLHHLGVDINAVDERVEDEDELDEVDTEADPQLEALLDSLRTMLAQNPDDARRQHLQRALDELTSASKEAARPTSRVEYVERLDCATPISPSMLGRGQLISGTSSAPGSPFAFAGRSPLLAGRSPLLRSRSSFVLAGSPLLSGRSPLLSGHSPLLPGRSPLLAGRSPLSSPRLGVVGLRSPLAPPSAFGLPPSLPELSPLSLPAQLVCELMSSLSVTYNVSSNLPTSLLGKTQLDRRRFSSNLEHQSLQLQSSQSFSMHHDLPTATNIRIPVRRLHRLTTPQCSSERCSCRHHADH